MTDTDAYLIYSNQHGMWWRPDKRGYTSLIEEAGRYTRTEAEAIVSSATLDGELKRRRVDPVTEVQYASVDEVLVLAPECIPAAVR